MSELLNKSRSNKKAAELLVSSKDYAPSVHCSYYSLLQNAHYLVVNQSGKSLSELIARHRFNDRKASSHHVIRAEMLSLVKSKLKSKWDFESFNTSFNLLKKLRENADYSEMVISEDMAVSAIRNNTELIKILSKIN